MEKKINLRKREYLIAQEIIHKADKKILVGKEVLQEWSKWFNSVIDKERIKIALTVNEGWLTAIERLNEKGYSEALFRDLLKSIKSRIEYLEGK